MHNLKVGDALYLKPEFVSFTATQWSVYLDGRGGYAPGMIQGVLREGAKYIGESTIRGNIRFIIGHGTFYTMPLSCFQVKEAEKVMLTHCTTAYIQQMYDINKRRKEALKCAA